jgi:hypothetical protein
MKSSLELTLAESFRSLRNFAESTRAQHCTTKRTKATKDYIDCVIPAWSAGIQADMDVSGRILRTWMPAIHAGMTRSSFSCFVGGG